MAFFYIEQKAIRDGEIYIEGPLVFHLRKTLRCRMGERITVVDPFRNKYSLVITQLNPKGIRGKVEEVQAPPLDSGVEVLLAQGIPKGRKFETVLQKATELGVESIFPLFCERTLVPFREKRIPHDMQRWQNIVIGASQQSQRLVPPQLSEPSPLDLFLENLPDFDLGLLLYEKEKKNGVRSFLRDQPFQKRVLILVGPEGGFSEKEVEDVIKKGFVSVSLGERILRTETAGPFLVGLLQYEWGDIR